MHSFSLPFLFLLLPLAFTVASQHKPTAYEILKSYNFPVGLLPNSVTGYEIDSEKGAFKVALNSTCKFNIQSYQLEYKSAISGVITNNRISDLKGVSVKVLVLWLNIVEIILTNNNELQFSVGITSANFPVDGFDESPTCGCGFDCNTSNHIDMVSSS